MRTLLATALVSLVVCVSACHEQLISSEGQLVEEAPLAAADGESASKNGPVLNFVAPLSGDQEAPLPVETNATGLAKFQLKGGTLSYKLIVANIEGVTQAHIHCGAAGVAGPVVAFLFGFVAEGVTVNGVLAEGTIGPVIPRPDSPECPGGVADFDDLIEKMQSGDAYVNVHTLAYPGGEIRGQIDRGNGVQ